MVSITSTTVPQPFPSWTISTETNWLWAAPTPMPADGQQYSWDETNQRVTNNANKAGAGDGGGSLRDIMIHRHSQAVKQRRRAVKREKELYKIRANTHTFGDHNVFFC